MVAVLFVCLGNICRSPAAQGILEKFLEKKHLKDKVTIASAGLGDWHVGQLPDPRMRAVSLDRGVTLVSRAQLFDASFFNDYDYILAADQEVLNVLYSHAKSLEERAKIQLMTFCSKIRKNEDIPDPYDKNESDFHLVYEMLEEVCENLCLEIDARLKKSK